MAISLASIVANIRRPMYFLRTASSALDDTVPKRLTPATAHARTLTREAPSRAREDEPSRSGPPKRLAAGLEPEAWRIGSMREIVKCAIDAGLNLEEIAAELAAFGRTQLGGGQWTPTDLKKFDRPKKGGG